MALASHVTRTKMDGYGTPPKIWQLNSARCAELFYQIVWFPDSAELFCRFVAGLWTQLVSRRQPIVGDHICVGSKK